ncbi:MAG: PKD domain-containing protein, partial [Desulfobacterales bacterium]|nr:PKD domain-containing protein [Desulfobacterales bacterium]
MDAIASSNSRLAFATTGPANVTGRYYYHLLTDMVDMYAYGQVESGGSRGGWRYSWHSGADNSACQWAAIGMLAAEDNFGINIPQFVKDENDIWLDYSYNGTGFGYSSAGNGVAQTPSGMVQLAFGDKTTTDPRWRTAEDYIANNWFWQNNNYYAVYSLVKSLKLAQPNPVVTLSATGLDWYNDPTTGVRKRIIDSQGTSGTNWGSWDSGGYGNRGLDTSWAVIMLTPTLFAQPPVADAGDDIIWAYDLALPFNASGSFHLDPTRSIVKYEWDFDGDGTYDFTTTNPADPSATYTYPDPNPSVDGDPAEVYTVRLRVTDDNEPAQTDVDTREVTVAEPPHAPFAAPGGPYSITAGIPFTLDGSGSSDIDPGDSVSQYQWDLDSDGVWFDDVDMDTTEATEAWTYSTPGVYNIALKVRDNGVFNPLGCIVGVDCVPLWSTSAFTTVTVNPNLPPVANAGGPYIVDEGTPLVLDGSASSDPNGDVLSYAWDLDEDGSTDDSTDVQPTWTYLDGTYTVTLTVSDSLLNDTTTATVTVNDLEPTAGFTWAPEPQGEGSAVSFTDASTSSPDTITGWSWDFGGVGSSTEQNPSFTFNDNGTYPVTLIVTDEDGSTSTVTHTVTIQDLRPTAAFTWAPEPQTEGSAVNFTDASTSSPDTITGWSWDFGGVGSSTEQNPSFTFIDNDTYPVTLIVTDDDGSTSAVTHTVTVNDLGPTAVLTGDATLNEGQTGSYDATGSTTGEDAIVSYEWDWNYSGAFNPSGDTGATQSHAYDDNGTYIVAVRVTDDDGSTDIATLPVTVNNVAPIVEAGPDQTVDEGDPVTFAGSFTDPGAADTHAITWDFGDATPAVSGTLTPPAHTYADNGVYTVTLTVVDDDGGIGSDTLTVTVNNVAPTVEAGPDQTANESAPVTFAGSFTDPGTADTHTITWDFGDGGTASGDLTPSHSYGTAGTYTVTLTVTDNDGGVGVDTLTVTVSSVLIAVEAGPDQTVNEGDTVSFNGSANDPGVGPYTYTWNFGDGSPEVTGSQTPTHVYADNGTYTVTLTVTGDTVGVGSDSLSVTVSNVAPIVDAGPDQTADEGDTVAFAGSFTDPGTEDTHTVTWDFGDGTPVVSGTLTPSHVYADDGAYTVTLTVVDNDGGIGGDTLVVTVNNVAPTVEAGPDQTVNEGDTVNFAGSFTDPAGTADTYTITWDFGDGGTASGDLTPSHSYGTAGTYTVTLTVTDGDGGIGSDTLTVTVESGGPICGDLDGDGDVDGADRNVLRGALRSCTGDARFVGEADYDGDGCITYNDYRLWYGCYKDFITP